MNEPSVNMDVSIVIPLFNEEESLQDLCRQTHEVVQSITSHFELIFVDDGSTDGSLERLKQLQKTYTEIKIIAFRKNYGKAAGLQAGFNEANGNYVITMDADLQDDPKEIPKLLKKLEAGFDLVSGWKKKRFDPIGKTLPSKIFNFVTALVSGVRLHDFNCGFKAYRNEVVKNISVYGELHRFIPVLAHKAGFRVGELVVLHHPRRHGASKYGLKRFVSGFLDLITVLFITTYTKKPLHLFGLIGMAFFIIGFGINLYFAIQWIREGHMHIRPLILFAFVCILLGIQFFSLGLLGEMISHTNKKAEYFLKNKLE